MSHCPLASSNSEAQFLRPKRWSFVEGTLGHSCYKGVLTYCIAIHLGQLAEIAEIAER